MKGLIRKNKDKSSAKRTLPEQPASPPSLTLPAFIRGDSSSNSSVTNLSHIPAVHDNSTNSSFLSPQASSPPPSGDSVSASNAPLYARFARGTFDISTPAASSSPAPEQLSPPRTLRHRASHESGSGFRSGGVRDEVERLAVAKRNIGAGARGNNGRESPSVRSVSGDASVRSKSPDDGMGTRSLNVVLPVVLPRPPTPPPPSPPKQRFTKLPKASANPDVSAPVSSADSTVMATATSALTPLTPSSLAPTSPSLGPTSASLQPPSSPGRKPYSPLAAFGLPKLASAAESTSSSNALTSTTPIPLSLSPTLTKPDQNSVNLTSNLSNPNPDTASRTSSPSPRVSPVSGPGFASLLRAASGRSGGTSPVRPVSPIRTASPMGIASPTMNGEGHVNVGDDDDDDDNIPLAKRMASKNASVGRGSLGGRPLPQSSLADNQAQNGAIGGIELDLNLDNATLGETHRDRRPRRGRLAPVGASLASAKQDSIDVDDMHANTTDMSALGSMSSPQPKPARAQTLPEPRAQNQDLDTTNTHRATSRIPISNLNTDIPASISTTSTATSTTAPSTPATPTSSTSRTTTPTPTTSSFPSRSGSTTPSRTGSITPSRLNSTTSSSSRMGMPTRSNTTHNPTQSTLSPSRSGTKMESVRERVRRLEEERERERQAAATPTAGVGGGASAGTVAERRASLMMAGGVGVMGSALGVGIGGEKDQEKGKESIKEKEKERKESSGVHARERSTADKEKKVNGAGETATIPTSTSTSTSAPASTPEEYAPAPATATATATGSKSNKENEREPATPRDRDKDVGTRKDKERERERKSSSGGARERKLSSAKIDKESGKPKEREREREHKTSGVEGGRERKLSGIEGRERKVSTTKDKDRERKHSAADRERKSSTAERKSILRGTTNPKEESIPVPVPPLPASAKIIPNGIENASLTTPTSSTTPPTTESSVRGFGIDDVDASTSRPTDGNRLASRAASMSSAHSANGHSEANTSRAVYDLSKDPSVGAATDVSGSGTAVSSYNDTGASGLSSNNVNAFQSSYISSPPYKSTHGPGSSSASLTYVHNVASSSNAAPPSFSTSSNGIRATPSSSNVNSHGTTYVPSQPTTASTTPMHTTASTMTNFAGIGAGSGRGRRKPSQFELDADPFARDPISVPATAMAMTSMSLASAEKGPLPSIPIEEADASGVSPVPVPASLPAPPASVAEEGSLDEEREKETQGKKKHGHRKSREERRSRDDKGSELKGQDVDGGINVAALHVRRNSEKAADEAEASCRQSVISTYSQSEDGEDTAPYPLERHLVHPYLLHCILRYLSYTDVLSLLTVNRGVRHTLMEIRDLREEVLERFLNTVGYVRWVWAGKEGLVLSLKDLNAYLRGVSTPTHEYATIAEAYIAQQGSSGLPSSRVLRSFAASCRAFTRLVVRLRQQAEAEHAAKSAPTSPMGIPAPTSPLGYPVPAATSPFTYASQPATPTQSGFAGYPGSPPSTSGHGGFPASPNATAPTAAHSSPRKSHTREVSASVSFQSPMSRRSSMTRSADSHMSTAQASPPSAHGQNPSSPTSVRRFSSPLFRLHHAPLLRVFVPSPNGAWLSDESVLECEKELKRAGVINLLRPGDVVWDTAVLDEGNAGRLVWDGNYLIDLDYTYSLMGELPRYMHSFSFPPSYFHRVIRSDGNPLCQLDVTPWGAEIAQNVQLVQDRAITETPQGSNHTVLRWIHRSRFQVLPSTPIPESEGLTVHAKWVGTVVIEAEGTNEGLGNLLGRCGEEVAEKAVTSTGGLSTKLGKGDAGRVFRILRARSRPGEIWVRCVMEKEKIA